MSAKILRAMIARGDLPAKRIRGRWWIARVDLDEGPEPPGQPLAREAVVAVLVVGSIAFGRLDILVCNAGTTGDAGPF